MRKLAIVIPQELSFPLAEGLRKQAWWTAQAMKDKYDVTVYDSRSGLVKRRRIVDGIRIVDLPKFRYAISADIIHFFGCPSPDLFALIKLSRFQKLFISMFDGELCRFWESRFSMLSINGLNRHADRIFLQTGYQKNIARKFFDESKIELLPPLIPALKRKGKRSKTPSILFMSHLSETKGIRELLLAYLELVGEGKDIELVIADSKISRRSKDTIALFDAVRSHGGKITVKGIVDPSEELSKAWVYAYPIRSGHNTFSVPLSLIEATQVGTPFISSDVAGMSEYFDGRYLLKDMSPTSLKQKIQEMLKQKKKPELKMKIGNRQTIKRLERFYDA